ncbi:MAG: M16 family metallopeptidase [Gammaproteobacteria bacterium]
MGAKWMVVAALALVANVAQAAPKIEHWTLDNGARVYFVRAKELPLLQLRLVFDAGSSRDPAERSGVALYTGRLLNFGAAGLDADAIAAGFENLGAEFGTGVDRDMATVELRSLSDRKLLRPALDLFATVISEPTFPQDALDRERARGLVGLQRDAQQPGVIAEKAFMRSLYGAHPYARPPVGTEASLKALTRDDLTAHHRRYYTGANAWLAIVGDASIGEAKEIARRVLGRLPRGEAAAPLPAPPPLAAPVHEQIPFPASQSHIRLGQPAIARTDPDYFPLLVGNYTLGGGGLVSRLADEIREKRGYAYSVYSYFYPLRVAGPFMLGLQTKNAQRDDALKVVRKVLTDFVTEGPTPKELEAAKKHLTGSFPLRLDSNKKIADQLSAIAFYGLPLTYLDDFIPKVEAVTIEQIRDAFKRRVDPERLATVIVGGAP